MRRKHFSRLLLPLLLVVSSASYANIIYELTGATGTMKSQGVSEDYNEVELGLIYQMTDFLHFRGSAFTRFTKVSYSGLNLSSRFSLGFEAGDFAVISFVGPGYRFMSRGLHAPLAEGGVSFLYPGIQFSLGYRTLFNEAVNNGLENDGQFFLSFNGVIGGSLLVK